MNNRFERILNEHNSVGGKHSHTGTSIRDVYLYKYTHSQTH